MKNRRRRQKTIDYPLLGVSLALLALGLIMVYSSSAIYADRQLGSSLYFIKRQIIWAIIALSCMTVFSKINYNHLKEWVWPIMFVTTLGLIAALFSVPVAGVRRWIHIGPIGVQPSEFAKLTCVIFLAYYLDRNRSKMAPLKGLFVPMGVIAFFMALIGKGPDLGSPILIFMVTLLILFIGGVRIRYLLGAVSLGIPIVIYELTKFQYRMDRLLALFAPWDFAKTHGYQLTQALMAVGSGGWFGKGIGGSKLKLMYLPAPHTDFIFPVMCEELGLLGAIGCLALFMMVLIRGLRIARTAPNLFGTLLAAGISFMIAIQAFINIAMSIGLLPTKGIPLPFISFGGSSLVATMIGIGILLNISRHSKEARDNRLEIPLGAENRPRR